MRPDRAAEDMQALFLAETRAAETDVEFLQAA
jgi:hypothetical protein